MVKESTTVREKGSQIQGFSMRYCEKFNELPWHDSALLKIEIDRKSPGENDCVQLCVKWPNGNENLLVFSDCYFFEAKMNFGVLAEESILNAYCDTAGEELFDIKTKWASLDVELETLVCYTINTNSTNSTIKILALSMNII